MRSARINMRPLWFVNAIGETKVYDSNGKYTGEYIMAYSLPQKLMINMLSKKDGGETIQSFGSFTDYDRHALTTYNGKEEQKPALYTAELALENGLVGQKTKCWFGIDVDFDNLGEYVYDKNGNKLIHLDSPTHNYEVVKVLDSLNELRVAFKKVKVNSIQGANA